MIKVSLWWVFLRRRRRRTRRKITALIFILISLFSPPDHRLFQFTTDLNLWRKKVGDVTPSLRYYPHIHTYVLALLLWSYVFILWRWLVVVLFFFCDFYSSSCVLLVFVVVVFLVLHQYTQHQHTSTYITHTHINTYICCYMCPTRLIV